MSDESHDSDGPPKGRIALLIAVAAATGLILGAVLQSAPHGPSTSSRYDRSQSVSLGDDSQGTVTRIDVRDHQQSFGWPIRSSERETAIWIKNVDGVPAEITPDDIAQFNSTGSFLAPGEIRRTWKLAALGLNALFYVVIAEGSLLGLLLWRRRRRMNRLRRGLCVRCGYNLTGATDFRCPECGLPFQPDGGHS